MTVPVLIIGALCSSLFLAPAVESPAQEAVPPLQLSTLSVSARAPADSSVPDQVILLEDLPPGADSIEEILSVVPGVLISGSSSGGGPLVVSYRGLGSARTVVMLDDRVLNDPSGVQVDLGVVDLASVERVEVFSGASSGSAGAVIRLCSARAPARDSAELALGYGSFDHSRSRLSVKRGQTRLSWELEARDGSFPFTDLNSRPRTMQNGDSTAHKLSLGSAFRAGPARLRPRLSLSYIERGAPGLEQFPSLLARESRREAHLELPVDAELSDAWKLSAGAAASIWSFHFEDPQPYLPPPKDSDTRSYRISTRAGISRSRPATLSPFLFASADGEHSSIERLGEAGQSHSRITGHAEPGLVLSPFGGLNLTVGSRVDAAQGYPLYWGPRFELGWRPSGMLSGGFELGRSRRLPTFDELYFQGNGVRGNPALLPEESWSAELWVALKAGPLGLKHTLYRQELDRMIAFVPVSAYLVEARNIDRARLQGLESTVSYRERHFHAESSLSLSRSDDRNGHRLPYHPALTSDSRLSLLLGPHRIWFRVEARSRTFFDSRELRSEEGRILLHAGGQLSLLPYLDLRLSLQNLGDRRDTVDRYQTPLPGFNFFVEAVFHEEES